MLECVVNVSEGSNTEVLAALSDACASDLLDVHSDADHNRSVFTLIGTNAPKLLTKATVSRLSLPSHEGVHPRLGVVDVVPFVPLGDFTMDDALQARNEFAQWVATELNIPCFLYGPERTLPFIRKNAWSSLVPDIGPHAAHSTAGAICVGAREPLIAYNVWLEDVSLQRTKDIASLVRTEHIRTLGLQVGRFTQVSVNLVSPTIANPVDVVDAVKQHVSVHHCELVGLLPEEILHAIPQDRWEELDLAEDRTIESRLQRRRD